MLAQKDSSKVNIEVKSGKPHPAKSSMSTEVSIEEAFCGMMTCARLVGLHIWAKNKHDNYVICPWGLLPLVLLGSFCLVVLGCLGSCFLFATMPYWYFVLCLPHFFAHIFCILCYAQTLRHARRMAEYLEGLRQLSLKRTRHTRFLTLGSIIYPTTEVLASLYLLPGPKFIICFISLCITSIFPAVLDVYIGAFIQAIARGFDKLVEEARTRETWSPGEVHSVYQRWLRLLQLLHTHNQVFSLTTEVRVLLLMVEALAYVFVGCSLDTLEGNCTTVLALGAFQLSEVIIRLHSLCMLGHGLASAGEELRTVLADAEYGCPSGSPQGRALTRLVARLEGRPPRVLIWGMDSLTAGTLVQVFWMVISYLVVVKQLSPVSGQRPLAPDLSLTDYDHCFSENSSTTHHSPSPPAGLMKFLPGLR
ncbi:uncharacterized protein [Procambarus clarkii]|uniref:uncharacterized protein n=1 Tax=Procambarus clarkii TaxID=6728 RepID=UPI0037449D07